MGKGLSILALLSLASVLAALPALGQTCSATCDIVPPPWADLGTVADFQVTWAETSPPGCIYQLYAILYFGDGQSQRVDREHIYHIYMEPGDYMWKLRVYVDKIVSEEDLCVKTGTITAYPCTATCDYARVAGVDPATNTVTFEYSATLSHCTGTDPQGICTDWDWGDNTRSGSSEHTTIHQYPGPGTYPWSVEMSPCQFVAGTLPQTCTVLGSVTIGAPSAREAFGSIVFTADNKTTKPDGSFILSGNVWANGMVHFTGPITLTRDEGGLTGSLETDGSLGMALKARPVTLLRGPGLSLDVEGDQGKLRPYGLDPGTTFAFQLQGVPLVVGTSPLRFEETGVAVYPGIAMGSPSGPNLARAFLDLLLKPGGGIDIRATSPPSGDFEDQCKVTEATLTYSHADDTLGGSLKLNFPKLGTWTVDATPRVTAGCIGDLDFTGAPSVQFIEGFDRQLSLGGLTGNVESLCDITFVDYPMRGSLRAVDAPGFIALEQADLRYWPPANYFIIKGGTLKVGPNSMAVFPQGNIVFSKNPPGSFRGFAMGGESSLAIPDIAQGKLERWFIGTTTPGGSTESPSQPLYLFFGQFQGTFTIPDYPCATPDCSNLKAILQKELKSLPKSFEAKNFKYQGTIDAGTWEFTLAGTVEAFPYKISARYIQKPTGNELRVASEFVNLVAPVPRLPPLALT